MYKTLDNLLMVHHSTAQYVRTAQYVHTGFYLVLCNNRNCDITYCQSHSDRMPNRDSEDNFRNQVRSIPYLLSRRSYHNCRTFLPSGHHRYCCCPPGHHKSPSTANQDSVDIYLFFGGAIRPPEIRKAKFQEGKSQLQILGTDFTGDTQVEINGVIINRQLILSPLEGRLILRGTRQELNLGSGNNQVVVIRRGTHSAAARVRG